MPDTKPTPPKEWMSYVGRLGGKNLSDKKRAAILKNLEKAHAAKKAKKEENNAQAKGS